MEARYDGNAENSENTHISEGQRRMAKRKNTENTENRPTGAMVAYFRLFSPIFFDYANKGRKNKENSTS